MAEDPASAVSVRLCRMFLATLVATKASTHIACLSNYPLVNNEGIEEEKNGEWSKGE
ncbi:hypothetical protein HYV73_03845 [Candidatus Uhrbacteria bacterium]|nr:hypothetical protein [Candidatus Uhrbacteria bacterium]